MKCTACGKELTKKEALFNEEHEPFCSNPFVCNEEHPNSVPNILARGGAVKLYTEPELDKNAFNRLAVDEETKEKIVKIATKPQSIRISKAEMALYVIRLQELHGYSLSEAIRHCISKSMSVDPLKEVNEKPVIKFTVPDTTEPNPEPQDETEPETEPAETEEEFTF